MAFIIDPLLISRESSSMCQLSLLGFLKHPMAVTASGDSGIAFALIVKRRAVIGAKITEVSVSDWPTNVADLLIDYD